MMAVGPRLDLDVKFYSLHVDWEVLSAVYDIATETTLTSYYTINPEKLVLYYQYDTITLSLTHAS